MQEETKSVTCSQPLPRANHQNGQTDRTECRSWSAVITSTGQMVSCHNLESSDSMSLSSLRHWYQGGFSSLDHVEAAPLPPHLGPSFTDL